MARETLKDYLAQPEVGAAGIDRISYKVDVTGGTPGEVGGEAATRAGLGVDPNTGKELIGYGSDESISSGYLSHITKDKNFYEFRKRAGAPASSANRGDVLPEPSDFIKSEPFVELGTEQDNQLTKNSNSGYFDDPSTGTDAIPVDELNDLIDKVGGTAVGSGHGAPRAANDLLRGVLTKVESDDPNDFVVEASVQALKRNNRFNIENNFIGPTFPATPAAESGDFFIDAEDLLTIPGYSGPDEDENGIADNRVTTDTSFNNLKNIGSSLLLRATGYETSDAPGSIEFVNSTLENISSGDLEEARDVNKKVMSKLEAMNATGFPSNNIGGSVRGGTGVNLLYDADSESSRSFGSYYNSEMRFTDNSTGQRIKTALRLVALVSAAKTLFAEIVGELDRKEFQTIKENVEEIAKSTDKVQAGKLILGQSRKSTRFVSTNYLFNKVLTVTAYNFEECFNEGVFTLFGTSTGEDFSLNTLEEKTLANSEKNAQRRFKKVLDFSDAPGYWHAVSNSIIQNLESFAEDIDRVGGPGGGDTRAEQDAVNRILNENDKRIKIINIIAIIGEKSLDAKNAVKNADIRNVELSRDPDALPNIPGHRVGKSRIGKQPESESNFNPSLGSETTLAWEQSSVPSMYLLPMNIVRAAQALNNSFSGENPMHGMLGSQMVRNTYTGLDTDGTGARIPNRVVKIVEDRLDAEYVPFYFHDLRTNEIIAFHAFLDSLSDTISPKYTPTAAFGRLDPVQTYQGTERSLQLSFTIMSTNREDYDEMWYKINKLVTMLYPQWTRGTLVETSDPDLGLSSTFYQPFSQVIGASPIIRLRVGDVIKSNYSKFALARTFGIGSKEVAPRPIENTINLQSNAAFGDTIANIFRNIREAAVTIFMAVLGSPQGLLQMGVDTLEPKLEPSILKVLANGAADGAAAALAEILVNGYANPLITAQIINSLKDPNVSGQDKKPNPKQPRYLNPNFIDGYFSPDDGKTYFTTKRFVVQVEETVNDSNKKKHYKVKVIDGNAGSLAGKKLVVRREDLFNSPTRTFSGSLAGILLAIGSVDIAGAVSLGARAAFGNGKSSDALTGTFNFLTSFVRFLVENPETTFMRPEVNPFARAFDTTKGRGLAGVISGVTFEWLNESFMWETDFNARAPMGCKVSFSFNVIHDIPPGLDASGYNRAPIYNVGEIMRSISGDPYEEVLSEAENNFRKAGARGVYLNGQSFRTRGDIKGKK